MEKTTVYLTSAQKDALARTAAAQGRSEALLIRAGIDVVTAGHRAAEAVPSLVPSAPPGGEAFPTTAARPRWVTRDEFARTILARQADPALRNELREIAPGSTDEMRLP
jgi:hypothetical protein